MNIRIDESGIPIVYCHEDDCDKEISELLRRGNDIICGVCGAQLGFVWDLPAQYLSYLIGG